MDLRLNKENIICPITLLSTEISQNAEHDFVLPDYCPDVFRVLKCSVKPSIMSVGINGNRLTFELNAVIRVVYKSEESGGVSCVEQSLDYSKSLDLPANTQNPSVSIVPLVEYVSCRVANSRRLDVRSNIVCRVRVTGERSVEAVCDAFGGGMELKKTPMVCPTKRLAAAKRITVIEELELPSSKPAPGNIIRCDAAVKKGEQKVIPGKLITKGEAMISLLYLPKDSTEPVPECMRFATAFSQIIDVEGLDSDFDTEVEIIASKCTVVPKTDEKGVLECEIILLVNVTALRYSAVELVTDAYSTKYECECKLLDMMPSPAPTRAEASVDVEGTLACSDGEISRVYDIWCEDSTAAVRYDTQNNAAVIYGKVNFCMLCCLKEGGAAYAQKECVFEKALEYDGKITSETEFTACVESAECSYTLSEDGTVKGKAVLGIVAAVSGETLPLPIESVELLTDKPKVSDKRCAVKICYTDTESSLWDTAKKYSASAAAIMEENQLDDKSSDGRHVLIIPIKN